MSRKANLIRKIKEYMSQGKKYDAHMNFFCDIKRDRQALDLIINEMDTSGVSFRDAVINLILLEESTDIANPRPKRKNNRQPKINNTHMEIVSDVIEESVESKSEGQTERKTTTNNNESYENNDSTNSVIETQDASNNSPSANLSAEDKEALRQRILNSYKV
jgi:hypothetical protein